MDFAKAQQTAPQATEIERLVFRYHKRESEAGRLNHAYVAAKRIGGTQHYFLVLDRRPVDVELDAIARGMARRVKEGSRFKVQGPRFGFLRGWRLRGWAALRRKLRRAGG